MSSAESADEDESATADTTRRSYRFQWLDRPWVWPLFGVVAVLVFELTANVGLAVAIFCAKLGLRDVRLGWWLYRRDPDRKRGTLTGLIAASMIGLKVTIASLITITALFVLSTVNPLNWNPGPVLEQCAISLGITTVFCLIVSLLISTWGFVLALRAGQRVWLDGAMLQSPVWNDWPPQCDYPRTKNAAIDIAQLGFLLQLPVIVGAGVWAGIVLEAAFPGLIPWVIGGTLAFLIASYIYLRILITRTVARHPAE